MKRKVLMILFGLICGVFMAGTGIFGFKMQALAAEEDVYDIILFWGQSNMTGTVGDAAGEKEPDQRNLTQANTGISQTILNNTTAINHVNVPVQMETAYDFHYSMPDSDPLVPILCTTETLGEQLLYTDGELVVSAAGDRYSIQKSQGTNMIPQFCCTYYQRTGHKVIAVMASNGGKEIAAFLPSDNPLNGYKTYIYEAAKIKYKAAVDYASQQGYHIGSKFWVAFQGESDIKNMNSDEDIDVYADRFNQVSACLADELGTEFGFVVETASKFYDNPADISDNEMERVKRVKKAQDKVIESNPDILFGSDFPYRQYFAFNTNVISNYNNYYHFTSAALSQIGYETAMNVGDYVNGGFAKSLALDCTEKSIHVNDAFQLSCTVTPDLSLKNNLVWESSDSSVVTVDNTGMVEGIKEGCAIIMVKTKDGSKLAFCRVAVKDAAVTSLSLSQTELVLKSGETASLEAVAAPEDAENKNIVWSCSEPAVATVENGRVTACSPGTAYILAFTEEGGFTASCKVTVSKQELTGIALSQTMEMQLGKTALLEARLMPAGAGYASLLWSSDNPAVVSAEEKTGLLTAMGEGTAQITVCTGDGRYSATCTVSVLPGTEQEILVSELIPGAYNPSMGLGSDCQLAVTCLPEDATDKSIYWISSDETIATVSQDGMVSSHGTGPVTITAIAGSSGVTTSFTIQVVSVSAMEIAFDREYYKIPVGNECCIMPGFLPENVTDKRLTWTSGDSALFTVDENGTIHAKKVGSAQLYAKYGDNLETACRIDITPCMVSEIKPDRQELTLDENQEEKISVMISPEAASNQTIKWGSSDTSVATVDPDGTVKAVNTGTTMITACSTDGSGITGYCIVTVKKPVIMVQNITVSGLDKQVAAGKALMLHAFILPSNATNQEVTWTSSNTAYAKVYSNGMVAAQKEGADKTVTITATAKDGSGIQATYTVKIMPIKVTSIVVFHSCSITKLASGKSITLQRLVAPSNASDKTVIWSSSNTKYATVNSNGMVRANAAGVGKTVTIKATAGDGSGVYGTYKIVIMKSAVRSIYLTASGNEVRAGKTMKITSVIMTSGYSANTALKWTSSNAKYATVSSNGVVTGREAGVGKTVTITAMATDGSFKKASYKVTIRRSVVMEQH